jgi:hypothetical protein
MLELLGTALMLLNSLMAAGPQRPTAPPHEPVIIVVD